MSVPSTIAMDHAEEAEERWGHTAAYRQSQDRIASYSDDDWATLRAEASEIDAAFVGLMEAGRPADATEAMAVAERHRTHISKWFYDCPPAMHAALGRLYVEDQRYTDNIDQAAPGLAAYMADAFAANSSRG